MPVKSQMPLLIHLINGTSKNKSKCLNAKTTSFCPLGFGLDLTFEPCHLSLFGVWDLVLEIWDFVL
jgi:hypothetical protein